MNVAPPSPRRSNLDRRVCVAANRWGARRAIGIFFSAVSRLGDGVFWYALMTVIALAGGWHGVQIAVQMVMTGLTALMLYRVLKRWTQRARPFRTCPGVIAHIPPLDEFSFPSGHTLQAVAFTTVAVAHYPMLAPFLIGFTALVGASRVVLGLHYPSDVLAATVIGGGLGAASLWAERVLL